MRHPVVLILAVTPLLLSGCDFIRAITGRPTSSYLKEMREAALQEDPAQRQRAKTTIQPHFEEPSDTVTDDLTQSAEAETKEMVMEPDSISVTPPSHEIARTEPVSKKYYIVVGSFRTQSIAEKTLDKYRKKGYEAVILSFSNSQAVGICPTDSQEEAQRKRRELIKEKACPPDSWIHQKK